MGRKSNNRALGRGPDHWVCAMSWRRSLTMVSMVSVSEASRRALPWLSKI
ncbi:Uncharacterised protein [Bordetella pertussis]|nr:Uncharacterised protein [Bordetella pertussis]